LSTTLSVINDTLADTGCTYIQVFNTQGDRYIFDLPTNKGRISLYPEIPPYPQTDPTSVRIITLQTLLALHKLAIREIEDYSTSIARSVTV
jgi:hypothetical protein